MQATSICLGAVFQTTWSPELIRVIAFDRNVVMYDTIDLKTRQWSLAKTRRKTSYFRLPLQTFLAQASYVRLDDYTQTEYSLHRPDLPFSFAQHEAIQWYDDKPKSEQELAARLSQAQGTVGHHVDTLKLSVAKVYLSPFGPKGSPKPTTLVEAQDGKEFTQCELLWHAWNFQEPHLRRTRLTDGVGIHRMGLEKAVPSYYVWGTSSKLRQPSANEA